VSLSTALEGGIGGDGGVSAGVVGRSESVIAWSPPAPSADSP
jgi:hypothetical protein